MRLVKSSGDRRLPVGPEALRQLRDIGGRLEHVIGRYGRLLRDATDGVGAPAELRDSVELMNSQLAYVARRLQELLVAEYEERHACEGSEGEMTARLAVGSR